VRRFVLLGLCLMLAITACARPSSVPGAPDGTASASAPEGTRDADIFIAVVRRYLTNPSENSFPGFEFPVVYVLSRVDPGAAVPIDPASSPPGYDIAADDQQRIIASLRDVAAIQFVADRDEVIVHGTEGCDQVRDGGILIVLAPPQGGPDRVEVGIHGFVACLGATWLTYVVRHDTSGWTVTGTTGPVAVA